MSETSATRGTVAIPRALTIAFWLWWPVVLLQSVLAATLVYAIVQVATVGGPAVIIIFILAGPILLGLLALVIGEIVSMFKLRRGSRGARGWLVVLAIVNVLLASRQVAAYMGGGAIIFGAPSDPWVMPATLLAVAVTIPCVAASVLPFIPAARAYFAKPAPRADIATPT